jgi:TonB family protein
LATQRAAAVRPEPLEPAARRLSAVPAEDAILRVAQIWRGEVMAERLIPERRSVVLGGQKGCDFTIPDLPELPRRYTMFRRGKTGYVLTLGDRMTGKLSLGGVTKGVVEFLREGGEAVDRPDGAAGSFRALPLGPGDWGIVHIDGDADHTIFFQFTSPEPALRAPFPAWLPFLAVGVPIVGLVWLALIVTRPREREDQVRSATAFSVVVHLLLLAMTLVLRENPPHFGFNPSKQALTGYLVQRPVEEPPPPPPAKEAPQAGMEDGEKDAPPASSSGEAGKSGGEGDKPRARAPKELVGDPAPSSRDAIVRAVQNKGILKERDKLAAVAGVGALDNRLGNALTRLEGDNLAGGAGWGPGKGTGVGPGVGTGTLTRGTGNGPGGGGTAHADVVTQGVIKTGGTRPPKGTPGGAGVKEATVSVSTGAPEGDFGGLTEEQVLKVVKAKQNAILYCFEKELQRSPNIGGKIVVTWQIAASGAVKTARVKSSSVGSAAVDDCITRTVRALRFPQAANGQDTIVNTFPFIFARR